MSISPESKKVSLDTAFKAHHNWKLSLQEAINRDELLDVEAIKRDDCCPLGIWLYREGRDRYGHLPEFMDLVAKHKNFHEVTSFVARIINGKDFETAKSMLSASNQFGTASREVGMAIITLRIAVI